MQGEAELSAVHPVHEREDEDATGEEAQEDDEAVELVKPGAVEAELLMWNRLKKRHKGTK